MRECLNCGYERQPKDEGIVPTTECPRCHVLYDKIGQETVKKVISETPKTRKSGIFQIKYVILLILVCAYGIYYFGITEGYIKKHKGERTMFYSLISLVTPKDLHEQLMALSSELVDTIDELNRFEHNITMLEAGEIQ